MKRFGWLALVLLSSAPRLVHADGPAPIVVVVESEDARVSAAQIRAGMSRALRIPMVAVSDRRAAEARGALSIAVERGGRRAHIHFMPRQDGEIAIRMVVDAGPRADHAGLWLVEHGVAAIRTSVQRTLAMALEDDVIDPWIRDRVPQVAAYTGPMTFALPDEVIDPFADRPPPPPRRDVSPYELGPEVIDPWRRATRERGGGLAAPRPANWR